MTQGDLRVVYYLRSLFVVLRKILEDKKRNIRGIKEHMNEEKQNKNEKTAKTASEFEGNSKKVGGFTPTKNAPE